MHVEDGAQTYIDNKVVPSGSVAHLAHFVANHVIMIFCRYYLWEAAHLGLMGELCEVFFLGYWQHRFSFHFITISREIQLQRRTVTTDWMHIHVIMYSVDIRINILGYEVIK